VPRKTRKIEVEVVGMLGVGLDNQDGHQRITRADDFLLVGGSEQTHEQMQDVAIRFNDSLQTRGKRLQDISGQEIADLIRKVLDK
jgi:hypothetical protein